MTNVLLLPARISHRRDAASAADDLAFLELEKLDDAGSMVLSKLLHIPHQRVVAYAYEWRDEQRILHLQGEPYRDYGNCPHCGKCSRKEHDSKNRCVRDCAMVDVVVFVHFRQRRFKCPHCGKRFGEPLTWIEKGKRHTERFAQEVYQRCRHTPHTQVAAEMWLDESTVSSIFKRLAQRKVAHQRPHGVVTHLGIDEISLRKGHKQYALVLSDLKRRRVLAVLPNRLQETLEAWLLALPASARQAIKVVSIDMWRGYASAVCKVLPYAKLVVDRFHVMQQLNKRLSQARRRFQAKADEATRAALKGCHWLFVKRRIDLTPEEQIRLQAALDAAPELRRFYLLKERFWLIFERVHTPAQAARFLRAWLYDADNFHNRYLNKFTSTLRNWWHEILAYFEQRVTNGFVEGINRAIRGIIRRAYGYHLFDNFRLAVLAVHG
jgi:transposase